MRQVRWHGAASLDMRSRRTADHGAAAPRMRSRVPAAARAELGFHRIIAVDALTDPVTIYLGARPLAAAPIRPRFSPNGLATSEVMRPEWRCRVWRPHVVPTRPAAP